MSDEVKCPCGGYIIDTRDTVQPYNDFDDYAGFRCTDCKKIFTDEQIEALARSRRNDENAESKFTETIMEYHLSICLKILQDHERADGSMFTISVAADDVARQQWGEHVHALKEACVLDAEVHRSALLGRAITEIKVFGLEHPVGDDLLKALSRHPDQAFSNLDELLAFLDELLSSQLEE